MEVKIHGVYKHYKGDHYIVEDIATHSETMQRMVVYRGLYEDAPLWVRPYELFNDKLPEEQQKKWNQTYRFQLEEIQSVR